MTRLLFASAAALAAIAALLTLIGREPGRPASAGAPASFTVNTTDDHGGHRYDAFLSLREAVALATGDLAVFELSDGECAQVIGSSFPDACETQFLVGAAHANTILFDPDVFSVPNDPLVQSIAPFVLDTNGTTIDGSGATVVVDGAGSFDCFELYGSENTLAALTIGGCRDGVAIHVGAENAVDASTIVSNSGHGIFAGIESSSGAFTDNHIGAHPSGNAAGNGLSGILLLGSNDNTVARNVIANNGGSAPASLGTPITFDTNGVTIDVGAGNNLEANTFRDNAGIAIDLGGDGVSENDPGDGDGGANLGQNFPDITAAIAQSPFRIDGFLDSPAGFSYRLDFYENEVCDPSGNGEGSRFLDSSEIVSNTSPSPFLEYVSFAVTPGKLLTVTATNLVTNNTSEMSECFVIGAPGETPTPTPTSAPTPTPTPTPAPGHLQGDVDCDDDVDAIDVLKMLGFLAGLPFAQQPGCPGIALPLSAPSLFGDIDCDGDVDAVDALQILRFLAGLPVNQQPACALVGQLL